MTTAEETAKELLARSNSLAFENQAHQRALKARLMVTPSPARRGEWLASLAWFTSRHRYAFAGALATACVLAVLVHPFARPGNVFAQTLEALSGFPVVHYRLRKRAMENQWGPIIDPREPLQQDDEVWFYRNERGAIAYRYEAGLEQGDRFVYLARDGQTTMYKPAQRLAHRWSSVSDWAFRLGPVSLVETAAALPHDHVQIEDRGDSVRAIVELPGQAPTGPMPVRISEFTTRQTFVFDARTQRLASVQIDGLWQGVWITLLAIDQIEYLPYDAQVFELDTASDTAWIVDPLEQGVTEEQRHLLSDPLQVARLFFTSWIAGDFEAMRLCAPSHAPTLERDRTDVRPVELVSLAEAYAEPDSVFPGVFVPYEIRMSDGSTRSHRLAIKRNHDTHDLWQVSGGIF